MVNKREKNEGAKKTPATTTPKRRTAAKPKATARVTEPVPAAKPTGKKAAKAVAVSHLNERVILTKLGLK